MFTIGRIGIVVALSCSLALSRIEAACTGDCDGSFSVSISELITGVRISLGGASISACSAFDQNASDSVSINELVAAVNRALSGCGPTVTAAGLCLTPGTTGLVPCAQGTDVRVLRCDDSARCLTDADAYTEITVGRVAADGRFTVQLDPAEVDNATLIFEAVVDPASETSYRVIDLGPAAAAGTAAGLMDIVISPATEAAARLLEMSGLQNFDADGRAAVTTAVIEANVDTNFAGQTAAGAADLATQVAADDPAVQMTIMQNRMTPTPSPTQTGPPPTNTATPTMMQNVSGSIIVYENLQFTTTDDDPTITFANESEFMVHARCFYVNTNSHCSGSNAVCQGDGDCAPGESCAPGCRVLDQFSVAASSLGSLSWRAASGDGGEVPPIPEVPFSGELVCVEVDLSGSPLSGNHIAGLQRPQTGAPLAALALLGYDNNDGDTAIALGVEYDACPPSVDPARIASCWSQSGLTFTCGTPGPTATPTPTPMRATGSILIYENLDVTASSDPTLSIGNARNNIARAYCFYAGAGCALTDFTIELSRQSSLSWQASEGLAGQVPALPGVPFSGELVCIEVDEADFPFPQNGIYGAALPPDSAQVAAIALNGTFEDDGDKTLVLGFEYEACPAAIDSGRIESCWSQSAFTFQCQ